LSGLSRFCEKPCSAFGGPLGAAAVDVGAGAGAVDVGEVDIGRGVGDAAYAAGTAQIVAATINAAARGFTGVSPR
jgi:hypothetical protein